jgi:uncharacterized protein (TIGR03437 family)
VSKLLFSLLFAFPLLSQISQLATTADGATLLFRTTFRLQTETELGSQAKIYQWQHGQFTRLDAAKEVFLGLTPDVFNPFLTSDGSVYGWQIQNGCSYCRFLIGSIFASHVENVTLPNGFPTGTLSVSANGRFYVADVFPNFDPIPSPRNAKYFDANTRISVDLPSYFPPAPVIRQVSNDGTVLFILPDSPNTGSLALWKPDTPPVVIYSGGQVLDAKISADGGDVAFEFLSLDPQRKGEHLLAVYSSAGATIISTQAAQPPNNMAGVFQPSWDLSGTNLLYRQFDPITQTYSLALWNAATNTSTVVLSQPEGISNAVISGDAKTIWAVTTSNRLLRANLPRGTIDEILPPLAVPSLTQSSSPVPGSAVLIRGSAFNASNTVSLDGKELPILAVSPEGIWVQVPWEYRPSATLARLTISAPGNPFQTVVPFQVSLGLSPQFVGSTTADHDEGFAKASHQDFASLITPENPARSGETIHVYLTGLGPLDGPIGTGETGPDSPPLHPLATLSCSLDGFSVPILLTYAAGLVGFYQADIALPVFRAPTRSELICQSTTPTGGTSTRAYLSTAP